VEDNQFRNGPRYLVALADFDPYLVTGLEAPPWGNKADDAQVQVLKRQEQFRKEEGARKEIEEQKWAKWEEEVAMKKRKAESERRAQATSMAEAARRARQARNDKNKPAAPPYSS